MIRQGGLRGGKRLPSFGLPRDLSLGGTKAKKSYKPNFNAVQSKDKVSTSVVKNERSSSQKPGKWRQKKPLGSSKNNKQGKYVETKGAFSEGMGPNPRSYSIKTSSVKDRQNIDALVLPKISSTDFMIKEDDLKSSRSLKYDDVINFDCDDAFQALRVVDHVTYEFDANEKMMLKKVECNGDEFRETHSNKKFKNEFKLEETSNTPRVAYSAFTANRDTVSDDKPSFSLFKFPDALLGFPGANEDNHSNLQDLPEGRMGKLIVRKSGKMEMNINNIKYVVMQDKINSFHQVMLFPGEKSMSTDPPLVTFGTLMEKYTVTSDWKELFQKKTSGLDSQ